MDVRKGEEFVPPGLVFTIYEDRAGSVWVGGEGGLSKFENGRFRGLSKPNGFPAGSAYGMTEDDERYFRDIYDHLIRIAELIDTYRDLLTSTMDVYLSTVSNRMNVVMKQLTIVATIFLPLSWLTGFFGQNFGFLVRNITGWQPFFFYGLGFEVIAVALLFAWFKRERWF